MEDGEQFDLAFLNLLAGLVFEDDLALEISIWDVGGVVLLPLLVELDDLEVASVIALRLMQKPNKFAGELAGLDYTFQHNALDATG